MESEYRRTVDTVSEAPSCCELMKETLSVHSHIYSHSSENRGWHWVGACMREPNMWKLHGPTARQPQQWQLLPSTCIFRYSDAIFANHIWRHLAGFRPILKKFLCDSFVFESSILMSSNGRPRWEPPLGKVNIIFFIYQKSQNVEESGVLWVLECSAHGHTVHLLYKSCSCEQLTYTHSLKLCTQRWVVLLLHFDEIVLLRAAPSHLTVYLYLSSIVFLWRNSTINWVKVEVYNKV